MIDANMTEADSQPVDSARVRVIIEPDSLVQAGGRVFRVANVLDFESVIGIDVKVAVVPRYELMIFPQ